MRRLFVAAVALACLNAPALASSTLPPRHSNSRKTTRFPCERASSARSILMLRGGASIAVARGARKEMWPLIGAHESVAGCSVRTRNARARSRLCM